MAGLAHDRLCIRSALGTPDAAGKVGVVVTATIERQLRTLAQKMCAWGNEMACWTERLGPATQESVSDALQTRHRDRAPDALPAAGSSLGLLAVAWTLP